MCRIDFDCYLFIDDQDYSKQIIAMDSEVRKESMTVQHKIHIKMSLARFKDHFSITYKNFIESTMINFTTHLLLGKSANLNLDVEI